MAQPSNATGVMDPQNRSLPSVFTPGITQEAVMQGGPQITDSPTGVVYAPLVSQIVDSAGANVAGVDSSHNQLVKVNAALPAGTNAIGHVIIDANSVATYAATYLGLTPAASCTDLVILNGSASKVVRVMRIVVSAITSAATGATLDLVLAVRSAADTSGTTVTAATIVPFDSNDAAATASITGYSANPTTGTLVGNIYVTKFQQTLGTATATDFPTNQPFIAQWGITDSKPIVLRGAAQGLAINFNGVSFGAGASVDVVVEWTESAS